MTRVSWRPLARLALGAMLACNSPTDSSSSAGTVEWLYEAPIIQSVVTDGARAYVMTLERTAVAVDVATGATLWVAGTATGDTTHTIITGITLGGGGCTVGDEVALCNDNGVVALDASTGAFLWRTPPGGDACILACPMAVRDSTAFWTNLGDSLVSTRLPSGARRWALGTSSQFTSFTFDSALIAIAYYGFSPAGATVAGVNDATGAVVWHTTLGATSSVNGLAMWQGFVLASASDGNLYALDRTSGAVAWTLAALDTGRRALTSLGCERTVLVDQPMIVLKNTLFVATTTGAVTMIDLQAHAVLHRTTPGLGPHAGIPLAADTGAVYVITESGALAAFSTTDAHLMSARAVGPAPICSVAVTNSNLLVTTPLGLYGISR